MTYVVGTAAWYTGWANRDGAAEAGALGSTTVTYSLIGGYRDGGGEGYCFYSCGDGTSLSEACKTLAVGQVLTAG